MRLRVGYQQSQFRPILTRFLDYYSILGPGVILRLTNPDVRLRVGHEHSQFRPILVHFMHYYSPCWGPIAISTFDDPRGAFTCPSSTLKILANYDFFHGLLLTVVGS